MKWLAASLAVLLMAGTSEAQRGGAFHGGRGFHGGAPVMRPGFSPHFNPGFRPRFNPGIRPAFRSRFNSFRVFPRRPVVISPFFGSPFFPAVGPVVPFYSAPIYSGPAYVAPAQTTPPISDRTIDDLRSEVQQLRAELQRLQDARAVTSEQPPQAAVPAEKAVPVIVILKDGTRIETAGYALVGSTLWILGETSAKQISISDVDVDATRRENLLRGVRIVIP